MLKNILGSLWQIAEQTGYSSLDDGQWEKLIENLNALYKAYRDTEGPAKNFCRQAVFSLQNFYQKKGSTLESPAQVDDRTALYNLFLDLANICEIKKLPDVDADTLIAKYSVCSPEIRFFTSEMIYALKTLLNGGENG